MMTNSNPLDMDYGSIVEWVQKYKQTMVDSGLILKKPVNTLLTTLYAQLVMEGDIEAGEWVKKACERHLKDLERSKNDPSYPWVFDEDKGWRPIRFIEKKCHPTKGSFDHLVMQPWQHFVVGSMFGWVDRKTGMRRFRESLIFVGRKNGKLSRRSKIGQNR